MGNAAQLGTLTRLASLASGERNPTCLGAISAADWPFAVMVGAVYHASKDALLFDGLWFGLGNVDILKGFLLGLSGDLAGSLERV